MSPNIISLSFFILIFILSDINAQTISKPITPPVTGYENSQDNSSYHLKIKVGSVSNHFPGLNTSSGTVLFSPTGVHTIYDLQSNAVPQTIWQDPLVPSNVHAVYMQSFQPGSTDRYTIYLFSENFGATWTNLGSVPTFVSGFPSIDGFTNGSAVIANHNRSSSTPIRTKIYFDLGAGFGIFQQLDPGSAPAVDVLWPKLVCTPDNKISFVAAQNPGVPYTNSLINLNPPIFSGYLEYGGKLADSYSVARASNGTIGHAFIGNESSPHDVFYRFSTNNGQSWSTAQQIWDWNFTDRLGVVRGIDIVFKDNEPYVVFNVSIMDEFEFYPELPSSIRIWSPNINGGIPKIIADSSTVPFFPNKGNTSDNFLPVCRPSIGRSSSGNFIAVAFSATSGHYSTFDSSAYYSGWITYSSNSGNSWINPEKITPENPLRDWRYISVSKSNNLTVSQLTVQMVCQSDSVAGTNVIGGSPIGDAELIGIRFITSATSLPSAPQLVYPPNGSTNILLTPLLDWNNVSNADNYRVQLARDTGFASLLIDQSNLASSQYLVTASTLSYDSVYYWRANATNSNGTSIWSPVWNFRTITFLPPAPILLSPPNNSSGISVTPIIDWSNVPSASSYNLQVAIDTSFTAPVINQTNLLISQYNVPSLTLSLNTTYYWKVSAVNSNGTGEWSVRWRFTTISVPSAPVLLSPPNGSTGISLTPLLDWNNVSNAGSYRLQLSVDSSFTVSIINLPNILVSEYSVPTSLLNNTKYYWRVNATNSAGTGDWSAIWNFTTLTLTIPTAPLLITPINGAVNIPLNPLLDWNNVSTAGSYKIQMGLDLNFVLLILDSNVSISQFSVPSSLLTYNSLYFWRVSATNTIGTGPWSSGWRFRTAFLSGLAVIGEQIPERFNLYNNYPNPFNPSTKIRFDLPEKSFVKINIYDFTGREINELINEQLAPGSYEAKFNSESLSSGVYFYRIEAGNFIKTKSMILIK